MSTGIEGTVRVWDPNTGKPGAALDTHLKIAGGAFGADGRVAVAVGEKGFAEFWEPGSDKGTQEPIGEGKNLTAVAISPDSRLCAIGGEEGDIWVWKAAENRALPLAPRSRPALWHQKSGENRIASLAFSPDGSRLLIGSGDRSVAIRDSASGKELFRLKGHQYEVSAVAWSPNGRRVLSASLDNTIKLWDPAIGREVLTLRGIYEVRCAAFTRDGRSIIGGGNGTAHIWSIATP
jgi:WD40 repeat protein